MKTLRIVIPIGAKIEKGSIFLRELSTERLAHQCGCKGGRQIRLSFPNGSTVSSEAASVYGVQRGDELRTIVPGRRTHRQQISRSSIIIETPIENALVGRLAERLAGREVPCQLTLVDAPVGRQTYLGPNRQFSGAEILRSCPRAIDEIAIGHGDDACIVTVI